MAARTAIRFQQIVKYLHAVSDLRIHDLNIYSGECVAFYGLSEETRDVLIKLITGAYPPDEGSLHLFDADSRNMSDSTWFDMVGNFGIYDDSTPLQENASVAENIAAPFRIRSPNVSEHALSASVLNLANSAQLTITDLSRLMSEASPVIRMKVRLARLLVPVPRLVLLCNPTERLSFRLSQEFSDLVKRTRKKLHYTLVIFTDDIRFICRLAERVLFLNPQTGIVVENQLRGWYHTLLPFLNISPAKHLQLSKDIMLYGGIGNSERVKR